MTMEQPDHPEATGPATPIAHLQQRVQDWLDSDRSLPADGAALLAALSRAPEDLSAENAPAAAEMAAFALQVQALMAAGRLEIGDDRPRWEAYGVPWLARKRPEAR